MTKCRNPTNCHKHDHTPYIKPLSGFRDRLIFELLYATGIRKSELFHVNTQDINIKQREIMIRLGKGAKDRKVPIHASPATRVKKDLRKAVSCLERHSAARTEK